MPGPKVSHEVMNIVRRDIHASETIISADHPDAKLPELTPEADALPGESSIRRFVGRFTLNTAGTETEKP